MSLSSSAPFRRSEEIGETNPLLNNQGLPSSEEEGEEENDRPGISRKTSPVWQFWNHPPFKRHVHFASEPDYRSATTATTEYDEREHDEEEGLLPVSMNGSGNVPLKPHHHHHHHHHPLYQKYGQWVMYLVLLLVGAIIGAVFSRELMKRNTGLDDGPMVPPVWSLPPPTGLPRNDPYLITASNGAVASEDKTCSELGLSILRDKNGSAVDSAITTTLCIGLLNAFSSGIGGGGFMVVRIPHEYNHTYSEVDEMIKEGEERVLAIDFRETSPAKSEKGMYGAEKAGRVAAQVGGLAVGVPGELRGLEMAHKMYGKLPWKDVVLPVAELAKGWKVSRELARRLRIFGEFMLHSPTWSAVYAPRGQLLVEGDFVQRINYGKTLEVIAEHGVDAFYEGEIAESSVKTIGKAGGIMTLDDLKNYKARAYPAIHSSFMGKEIYTTDVPSSGGILLAFLKLLEPYNIPLTGGLTNPLNVHRLIEGMKFAFGARSEITDPAPQFGGNLTRFKEFYEGDWADEKRGMISDNQTHEIDYYGLQHDTPIDHGTTHLSVLDKWGGAASVTSTVNLIWGSHVMDPKTGIIFNDEQDDFAVPGAADAFGLWPSPWNYPQPGKRPLSSTSASILLTPRTPSKPSSIYAIIGGSGGSRIFPSVAQVLLNLFSGMDISRSIEAYRVHNQIVPPLTTVEVGPEGSPRELIDDLKNRGQEIGEFDVNVGISEVQAIVVENGTIYASSDSRKNGVAAGY
ncbi:gamma-glutamyltransferase [Kwoniella mangroviensis CBS 10435]|uniref:Glutathione hydrolase n=1 Tax=Kwoniella mangroviensis CBS 10435 TaxID=1331196 RepID=A0A1B9IU93_9TREE|nr:gamma-glutamyltransferase [Kwoniella mangroviensis CBS 10435]